MNKALLSLCSALIAGGMQISAADFEKHFSDSTLRIDYTFSGTDKVSNIYLDKMTATDGWYGKRINLNSVPLRGNGRIYVRDAATGDTIFMESFSHLFLEWVETDEAKEIQKSFEAVMRIPLPLKPADVTVELEDKHLKVVSSMTHRVSPSTDNLIRRPKIKETAPYIYLLKNGDSKEKIDIAIIAEGFTEEEMDSFYNKANVAMESILSHSPFNDYRDCFNFIAVGVPSHDSGVSVPRLNNWKNTALSSHFGTFYSPRYLTTTNMRDMYDILTNIPAEHIIILANTPEYGGGGIYNSYTLTSAGHKTFRPVVVHEFGHSFGGLADEYFYENDPLMSGTYTIETEPWEQNITTLKDFDSKWKDMLPEGTPIPGKAIPGDQKTVGVYEGAGYSTHGVYRPVDKCRMRYNDADGFCPVCQRAIARVIEFYIPSKE